MGTVTLISGDDLPRIAETARKVVDRHTGGNEDPFSFELLRECEGQPPEAALESCLNAVQTPSFLGGEKTIWLQDCSCFDQDRGASGAKAGEPVSKAFERLGEIISGSFPSDINLVISGPKVNKRLRFYKICSDHATVKMMEKPELNNRQWRQQVSSIIKASAKDHGIALSHDVSQYLLEVVGVDTGRIPLELEKLYCYAGENPTLDDAKTVCTGSRDAVYYALNTALGDRNLIQCFNTIEQLVSHSSDADRAALGLVRQAGAFFKDLLDARLLMQELGLRTPDSLKRLLENKSDKRLEKFAGNSIVKMHPFRAMNLAQQAKNYSGAELVHGIGVLSEAGKRMVSSSLPKRFVLEHMVASIVARQQTQA